MREVPASMNRNKLTADKTDNRSAPKGSRLWSEGWADGKSAVGAGGHPGKTHPWDRRWPYTVPLFVLSLRRRHGLVDKVV